MASWQEIAERVREVGFNKPRPGDCVKVAGVVAQLEGMPLPHGAIQAVQEFLCFSMRDNGLSERSPTSVYLTFFGEEDCAEYMKVGVSRVVKDRMSNIRTSTPLMQLWTWAAEAPVRKAAYKVEREILRHLKDDRVTGEWVKCRCSTIDAAEMIVRSIEEFCQSLDGGESIRFTRAEV